MKNIVVLGGGLFGCLTALKLSRSSDDITVHLVEAGDHLIAAFDSIELGGKKYNNGFHGIEYPRSSDLVEFISDVLDIGLLSGENNRKLLIDGEFISFTSPVSGWPERLRNHFSLEALGQNCSLEAIVGSVSDWYLEYLKKIGKRYADNFPSIQHLLAPWYFPADYQLEGEDEGIVFQNNVRSKKIDAGYYYPEGYIFEKFQEAFLNALLGGGVKVHLNVKFLANSEGFTFTGDGLNSDLPDIPDQWIYCASSAILLGQLSFPRVREFSKNSRNLLNALVRLEGDFSEPLEFSEVLFADEKLVELSRMSRVPDSELFPGDEESQVVQLELFSAESVEIDGLRSRIERELPNVLAGIGVTAASIVDLKVTRKVFFPDMGLHQEAQSFVEEWGENTKGNISLVPFFGPINMAKAWLESEKSLKLLSEIES